VLDADHAAQLPLIDDDHPRPKLCGYYVCHAVPLMLHVFQINPVQIGGRTRIRTRDFYRVKIALYR
jgi:hypothetical protein